MTTNFPAIVCTEHTLGGSPRIDGRRLAVGDVISTLYYGSLEEAVGDYELCREQVKQALHYCASRECLANRPLIFCHNCSLRSQQEGPLGTANLEEIVTETGTMVRGERLVFFGTLAELLADWQGQDWWLLAGDLLIDLRKELVQNE